MKLIKIIERDRREAMKAKDKLKSNLLGVLIGDATRQNKTPDDSSVLKAIKSMVKSLEETKNKAGDEVGRICPYLKFELDILLGYLPAPASDEELSAFIDKEYGDLGDIPAKHKFGSMMKSVKQYFGDAADMKKAGQLIKEKQNGS